jgi:gliding motility-associated-like protein
VLSYPRSDFYRGVTFSNSGEYVYLVEHKNLTRDDMHSIIWSFNARAPNLDEFENSKQMVKKFDYRIYFKIAVNPLNELMFVEVLEYGKKYRISSLSPQDGCRFDTIPKAYYELNEFVWQRHIPDMPTFTLQNKNEIKFTPSVQEICPGDQLKSTRIDNADYLWRPPTSLNDTTIFNPTINYYKNDYKDSLNYVLRVIDQFGCYHYDSTIVKILPIDSPLIKGPVSICPGSDSISYWIENNEPVKNRLWWINGGEIVSGSDKDSILVNWGQSNPSASLQYISLNNNECSNETDTLQVKIFKELETDKPNGDEILECGSLLDIYHVQPKYKYYFDWQILGGIIKSGQGTDEIEVEWHEDTKFGKLWINESISTDLEVCFGVSDTLTVANPEFFGPENIKLDMVTNILDDSLNLAFEYNLNYPEYYNDIILQIKMNDQWQHLAILPKEKNYISVSLIEKNESIYDFRLASQSLCYGKVYSSIHQNILLECRINEDEAIDLNWNEYNGWSDLSGYGILSASDDGKYEEKIAGISNTNLIGDILYDGFQHKIYSFAENESGKIALSNQCFIAYDFPLWAPNVITPNGDGYNDKFIIHNLEKHQENELYIYDRWGNMKGSFKNYRNDWSPYKLESGVYFYMLKTKKFGNELKGWLHVISEKK